MTSHADARALDAADPLRAFRDRIALPPGIVYLDGNSLGPIPIETPVRLADVATREWGERLIRSWNEAGWIGAPLRVGGKIARLIGAHEDEVLVADSTSVNLFKLIAAAAEAARPGAILAEAGNFPTDLHVARRAAAIVGRELRVVAAGDVGEAVGDAAVAVLTHVHYRTGCRHDMAALTARARAADTRLIWDLSHSVGAVPLDLAGDGVELAVGCGYKYLNGGPGAPGFLHVARDLHERLASPIAGWLGHAAPFEFADDYRPAPGIARFQAGTPPILSLAALEAGVDLMLEADMAALWAKSQELFALFAARMDDLCPALACVTPADPHRRGSHIAFRHDHAHAIVQAAIERGVIGDFRAPDVARFGITPLYLGYEDVWRATEVLADILAGGTWRDPRFAVRAAVT